MNIKLSLKSIYAGIMLILLYHAVFVKFPYLYIQRIIAGILFMLILPKMRFRKKDIPILILLWVYSMFTLLSALVNKDNYVYTHTVTGGFFHILIILEIFQVFLYVLKVMNVDFIIDIFLFLSFAYVICNDFFVVFYPEMFRHDYLVGNKFMVSYKHIECIVLYCMGKRKNIVIFWGIVAVSLYVSAKVNCMTGAVGIGILAVLLLMTLEKLLHKRLIFCGVTGISAAFPFAYDFFMGMYPIRYFIVNIPYEVWIGTTRWYPNAQNGFWNCVCEQGIICAVLLVITAVYIVGLKGNKFCYPLMCVVYVYAVLGTVEITMDITFIAWIIFLYVLKSGEKHDKRDNTRLQWGKIHFRMH